MVVPKRHIDLMSDLNEKEKVELIDVLAAYEEKGFNIYARESKSIVKSIPHQHTHLLRTQGEPTKFFVYLRRPYLLIRY
jgi:ATP adenylyltransferase